LVLRIIGKPLETFVNVGEVGHVVQVDRGQPVFVDQSLDEIVRGEDDIVAGVGIGEFGVEVLVGLIHLVDDLVAGFFLKQCRDVRVDIIAPVVHAHGLVVGSGAAAQAQSQEAGRQEGAQKLAGSSHFFSIPSFM